MITIFISICNCLGSDGSRLCLFPFLEPLVVYPAGFELGGDGHDHPDHFLGDRLRIRGGKPVHRLLRDEIQTLAGTLPPDR